MTVAIATLIVSVITLAVVVVIGVMQIREAGRQRDRDIARDRWQNNLSNGHSSSLTYDQKNNPRVDVIATPE